MNYRKNFNLYYGQDPKKLKGEPSMIKKLLDEKIEKNLRFLNECEIGSEESDKVLHELDILEEFRLDEMRISNEEKKQNLDRWISIGLQVGATLIPIIAYDIWYRRGLKFEETGTIGSPMVRNLMTKLIPNKKV